MTPLACYPLGWCQAAVATLPAHWLMARLFLPLLYCTQYALCPGNAPAVRGLSSPTGRARMYCSGGRRGGATGAGVTSSSGTLRWTTWRRGRGAGRVTRGTCSRSAGRATRSRGTGPTTTSTGASSGHAPPYPIHFTPLGASPYTHRGSGLPVPDLLEQMEILIERS